jgi:hypothetical protein
MKYGLVKDIALCVAFLFLMWAPLGRWILDKLGKRKLPTCLALSISLGMGAWGLLVLILGVVSSLYVPVLLTGAVLILVLIRPLRRSKQRPPERMWQAGSGLPSRRVFVTLLWIVASTHILIVVTSALAPEVAFDALNVYLPFARNAASLHRLEFAPNNWNSSMPMLPVMSYVMAFLFSGQTLAKLFNTSSYLLCGTLVYFYVSRRWSPLHGSTAALLFWSSPLALYEATTALIDLPLALYSTVAVFSLLAWTRGGERSMLWVSAIALGLALGCKYQAAFWIAPFALVLIWESLTVRKSGYRELIRTLTIYLLITGILFLPWLVRAWYYTGNPVFPLANWFFKSVYFTPAMEDAAMAAYRLEGVGRGWSALLTLPWTVSFHPGPFRGTLGAVFLLGLIMALLRRRLSDVRYGFLLVCAFFYEWALTLQEIRYLLPLAPVLAALTAFGILGDPSGFQAEQKSSETRRFETFVAVAGLLVVLSAAALSFPSVYPRWTKEWTYWHSYQPPFRYLLGWQSAQDYLRRDVPSIEVYDFVNEKLTQQDRILLLNDASQFYSHVPTLYSYTVEGESILLQESEEGLLRKLRDSHITHVLLNYYGIRPLPGVAPRQGVLFFLDPEFQRKHLATVFSSNNVVLYRVAGIQAR